MRHEPAEAPKIAIRHEDVEVTPRFDIREVLEPAQDHIAHLARVQLGKKLRHGEFRPDEALPSSVQQMDRDRFRMIPQHEPERIGEANRLPPRE
jgi:hypothetical protein